MERGDFLYVLGATYPSVDEARADYQAARLVWNEVGASYLFDAAVLHKTADGKVKIDDTVEAGTRHEMLRGSAFGLATGAIAALSPPSASGPRLPLAPAGARSLVASSDISRLA